ncbi:hypothetical protein AB0I94_26670 [Streptomyces sp. NPDC050147]|uniref:hypothetical protein n=1 Tax=Streptomyces sp. NPDC050147 TaxID=3155513 RepID=UPI003441F500
MTTRRAAATHGTGVSRMGRELGFEGLIDDEGFFPRRGRRPRGGAPRGSHADGVPGKAGAHRRRTGARHLRRLSRRCRKRGHRTAAARPRLPTGGEERKFAEGFLFRALREDLDAAYTGIGAALTRVGRPAVLLQHANWPVGRGLLAATLADRADGHRERTVLVASERMARPLFLADEPRTEELADYRPDQEDPPHWRRLAPRGRAGQGVLLLRMPLLTTEQELGDSRTMMVHDGVRTAVEAIRGAKPTGEAVPSAEQVGNRWATMQSKNRVNGTSGRICLTKAGNPYDKPLAVVALKPGTKAGPGTLEYVKLAWPTGKPQPEDCVVRGG